MKSITTRIDLQNADSEVKAYIYQMILEFQPYLTPQTAVVVLAKDPMELMELKNNPDDKEIDEKSLIETFGAREKWENLKTEDLKKMHRIVVCLMEGGTQIEREGIHEDIFLAIRLAKENLLETLNEIQDSVVSNQDRHIQIRSALTGGFLH